MFHITDVQKFQTFLVLMTLPEFESVTNVVVRFRCNVQMHSLDDVRYHMRHRCKETNVEFLVWSFPLPLAIVTLEIQWLPRRTCVNHIATGEKGGRPWGQPSTNSA